MNFSHFDQALPMDSEINTKEAKSLGWRVQKNDKGETEYITKGGETIENVHVAIEYTMYGRAFHTSSLLEFIGD